ncbi:MAG: hypothetical protein K0S80_3746 [Neobacillus sp.]|nr:hypothetical protein [Neobacillus sp.]
MIGYLKAASAMYPKHSEMFNKIANTLTDILNVKIIVNEEEHQ